MKNNIKPVVSSNDTPIPHAFSARTNAAISEQNYTYNETGLTYNEPGVTYGGLYENDITPLLNRIKDETTKNFLFKDIAPFINTVKTQTAKTVLFSDY